MFTAYKIDQPLLISTLEGPASCGTKGEGEAALRTRPDTQGCQMTWIKNKVSDREIENEKKIK